MQDLIARAHEMGVEVTGAQAEALGRYCDLLVAANAALNLTRVPEERAALLDRHILDSLAPLALGWPGGTGTLIDVGSGAGLPGVPLSILCPQIRVVLLDAQGKRVAFLRQVIAELGLNAEAVHGRAEDLARKDGFRDSFDIAAARAVAALPLLSEYLLPFVKPGGRMLALKGPAADGEAEEAAFAIRELGGGRPCLRRAAIPGRDWEHTVVWVEKLAPTPQRYPRRTGIPEKRPLRGAQRMKESLEGPV